MAYARERDAATRKKRENIEFPARGPDKLLPRFQSRTQLRTLAWLPILTAKQESGVTQRDASCELRSMYIFLHEYEKDARDRATSYNLR